MKRLPIIITIIVCLLYLAPSLVKAQGPDIDVGQVVDLTEDAESYISYKLSINNKSSEDLISSIEFYTPFDNYKVTYVSGAKYKQVEKKVVIDFGDSPINTNQSRNILIKGSIPSVLKDSSGGRSFYMNTFGTSGIVKSFSSTVVYPVSWGEPAYVSREVESPTEGTLTTKVNKDYYIVWLEKSNLEYDMRFKVDSGDDKSIIPLISSRCGQFVTVRDHSGLMDLVSKDSINILGIAENGSLIEVSGEISLDIDKTSCSSYEINDSYEKYGFKFPEIGGDTSSEKVKFISEYLKTNFRITEKKSIEESIRTLSGDRSNLSYIAFLWFRESDIASNLYLGWNYGQYGYTNNVIFWLGWFDEESETWKTIDIEGYITDKTDRITETNVQKVLLYSMNRFRPNDVDIADRLFRSSYMPAFRNVSEVNKENNEPSSLSILWRNGQKTFNKLTGSISLVNNSNGYMSIRSFKVNNRNIDYEAGDYAPALFPGEKDSISFNFYRKLGDLLGGKSSLNSEVEYQNGDTISMYSQNNIVPPVRAVWGILLVLIFIFLTCIFYLLINSAIARKSWNLLQRAIARLVSFIRVQYYKRIKTTANDKYKKNI